MTKPLYLKTATIKVSAEHWSQFAVLARSQALSASALLRQLVAKELHRAAKEATPGKITRQKQAAAKLAAPAK